MVFGCIHVLVSDCHRWDFVLYMKIIELNKMQYFTQVNEFWANYRKLCMTSGCGVGRLNWVKGEEDDPQLICAQTVIASSTFQLTWAPPCSRTQGECLLLHAVVHSKVRCVKSAVRTKCRHGMLRSPGTSGGFKLIKWFDLRVLTQPN